MSILVNAMLDACELSEEYASEGSYVALLFKSFLTFITKKFAIAYYKLWKWLKYTKERQNLPILPPDDINIFFNGFFSSILIEIA